MAEAAIDELARDLLHTVPQVGTHGMRLLRLIRAHRFANLKTVRRSRVLDVRVLAVLGVIRCYSVLFGAVLGVIRCYSVLFGAIRCSRCACRSRSSRCSTRTRRAPH